MLNNLNLNNKFGNKVNDIINEVSKANDVNTPKRIVGLKFDRLLFDNMDIKSLKEGVRIAKKYYETEASGNISLNTVKNVSKTGVDRISVGSITHSAPALDLKIEI